MASRIVYRVVSAVLALCVIPLAAFVPLLRIVGSISLMDSYVGESLSIYDVYSLFFSEHSTFDGLGKNYVLTDAVRSLMPKLITSGVCFALLLLISLVVLGFAAFSNKRGVILGLSAGALVTVIVMFGTFGAFARPLTDGTLSVGDLGVIGEGILGTIVSSLVSIKVLQLTSAAFLIAIVYAALFLWSVAFTVTEIGEPKKVKAKKAKK